LFPWQLRAFFDSSLLPALPFELLSGEVGVTAPHSEFFGCN
jgi:hypothetical protein